MGTKMLTLSTALLYCLCFASLANSTSPFSSLRHNEIRELRQHLKPGTFVLGVRVDSVTDMKKVAQMQHSQAKGGQKKAQAAAHVLGCKNLPTGLIIQSVTPGLSGEFAGLTTGDLITRVDNKKIRYQVDLDKSKDLAIKNGNNTLELTVLTIDKSRATYSWTERINGWGGTYNGRLQYEKMAANPKTARSITIPLLSYSKCQELHRLLDDQVQYLSIRGPILVETVQRGTDSIGTYKLSLLFENISDLDVIAIRFTVDCFDRFDRPVEWMGDSEFHGIEQENIHAGTKAWRGPWKLYFRDTASRFHLAIKEVRFEDGTVWKATDNTPVSVFHY
jgi:hypothetical protein